MEIHDIYMQRCLQLAELGLGSARPNPVVGALLVYRGRIIGEGYHKKYGGPHAEVECINSVKEEDRHLLTDSDIYVSLEPCAHFGKTPPCADLIIKMRIPRVFVGCRDPFVEVDGKGIEKLQQAGVEVTVGILEKECFDLNRRFMTFHIQNRPYIILKWAETSNGRMAAPTTGNGDRTLISNAFSNRLVHKWRKEEAAIMVGTNTAIADNPSLTTRLWKGDDPVRILLDLNLRVPASSVLLDGKVPTVVFNAIKNEQQEKLSFHKLEAGTNIIFQVCDALYRMNIQSLLVEGGAMLLQSFIDAGLYDEIRIIKNTSFHITGGLASPEFPALLLKEEMRFDNDEISVYKNIHNRNI